MWQFSKQTLDRKKRKKESKENDDDGDEERVQEVKGGGWRAAFGGGGGGGGEEGEPETGPDPADPVGRGRHFRCSAVRCRRRRHR